jgi:hypothetical protein
MESHNALAAAGPLQQLLLWISLFELVVGTPAVQATMDGKREAGDFQFGSQFLPKDPAQKKAMQLKELKVLIILNQSFHVVDCILFDFRMAALLCLHLGASAPRLLSPVMVSLMFECL